MENWKNLDILEGGEYGLGICLQFSLLILSEFKQNNYFLIPLKSSKNLKFTDHFRENNSQLICLNLHNIRSEFLHTIKDTLMQI